MGLWSKGLERAQTGEFRIEDSNIDKIMERIQNFFDEYTYKNNVKIDREVWYMLDESNSNNDKYQHWIIDDKLYICFIGNGANVTIPIKEKRDVSILKGIKESIIDWKSRVRNGFTVPVHVLKLYDIIDVNISRYEKSRNINDLYRIQDGTLE